MYRLVYLELASTGDWPLITKEFDFFDDLKLAAEKVNNSLWTKHILVMINDRAVLRLKW